MKILVTGAAGFIGSNVVIELLEAGHTVYVCDYDVHTSIYLRRIMGRCDGFVEPVNMLRFLDTFSMIIDAVVHMGAISSTTCHDLSALSKTNVQLTLDLFLWCAQNKKRFIYASSASVYGNDTSFWDSDDPDKMIEFAPLNDYARSKLATDMAIGSLVKAKALVPPQWVGLRFFNVYGPNENHKGPQASIIAKNFGSKSVKLFDIEASRDFIYVKDCSRYVLRFLDAPTVSGIFNIGSGVPRSFDDIARLMGLEVEKIPMPEELKGQYQFHTKSVMSKLTRRHLWFPPTSLEDGIADYTESYLSSGLFR